MNSFRFPRSALLLVAAALIGLPAGSARGQNASQNDLRRENQRLKTEVADLNLELEAARKEIELLREEIARLQEALKQAQAGAPAASRGSRPLEPEVVTVDETKPEASPRALFRAVVASYEEATGELEIGNPGEPARNAYMRTIERWVAKTDREYRTPIEWTVRIVESVQRVRRGLILRLQAVDPETDVKLGDPFDAMVSRNVASRLQQLEQRGEIDQMMLLRGVLTPAIQINLDRTSEGMFNRPLFIGPFAEFHFTVEAQMLIPKPEEKEETDDGTGEPTGSEPGSPPATTGGG